MSATHLALEIGDNLQMQFVDDETRHYVKVIGYVPGKSLLVTTPRHDGKFLMVREAQRVVVRLMSGNEIVGFTVPVLRSQVQPYPYLHLDFPKNMQAVTVRKALPVKLDMMASVRPCLKDTTEAGPTQTDHACGDHPGHEYQRCLIGRRQAPGQRRPAHPADHAAGCGRFRRGHHPAGQGA